ncbi:TetR/AcrR family transcriptional regulator [Brevibacterium sp. FME17]|uniref:TetR/AcrR family transcriptional regulator n=1 Tax=Brevibacterium sp. FME17 TaxID=2742606 RepID=UPI001867CADE|nr:TetR/AcrR family transcriptional regulator [Brevibacterium sp. FME17]
MTSHTDAETRRSQVADALMSTVAARGLDATTFRDVAEAAGVSVGLVQRHFRTRAELVQFGAEITMERTEKRLRNVTIDAPFRQSVFKAVESLLPLDQSRNEEFRVALAFFQASLHDSEMATIHAEGMTRLIDGLTNAFAAAQQAGELAPGHVPADEARGLIALIDGLSLHAVVTPGAFDPPAIRRMLHSQLDRVFTIDGSA